MCRAIGFPGSSLIEVLSSCLLLQGLFSFLPVIAHVLVSDEYCILFTHDFPSYGFSKVELHPERYSASVTITKDGCFCSGSKLLCLGKYGKPQGGVKHGFKLKGKEDRISGNRRIQPGGTDGTAQGT
jgi:hypothetical protein